MTKTHRIILVGIAILVLVLATAAWLFSRVDVKGRFESAASGATGLEVRVNGKVSLRLLPTLHVLLTDVSAKKGDREIAFVGTAGASVEYLPLLRKEAVLSRVSLNDVKIELEKNAEGVLDVKRAAREKEDQSDDRVHAVRIGHVSFSRTYFRFNNRQLGKYFAASDCSIDNDDFVLKEGEGQDFMKNVVLDARIVCKEMRNNRFVGNDVKLDVVGSDGKLKFAPITLNMMGGKGTASIDGDYTTDIPTYQVHYELAQLDVDELLKSVAPAKTGKGRLNFRADLSMQGFNSIELTRTAKGEASLRGKDLDLAIGDLDEKLRRYDKTQKFDLLDVGALFIAGPIGPIVTKGGEYAMLADKSDGETHVEQFVSHWKVGHGIAHANEVSMQTKENQFVLKGALNFPKKEYEDVSVAALDSEGCVKVRQRVNGPFAKPNIEKPDVLTSIAGPLRRIFEKVKAKKCERL